MNLYLVKIQPCSTIEAKDAMEELVLLSLSEVISYIYTLKKIIIYFWQCCAAYRTLVCRPGSKPLPPSVEAQSPDHWTARELPRHSFTFWGFPGGSVRENLLAKQETWVWSLSWEDPLEKGMVALSRILAWEVPWTEEPGEMQSTGSQRGGHNLEAKLQQQHLCF